VHTSGIAELGGMQELRAIQLMRNPTATRDDVYKVIQRYPFMFPTGTLEIYSNTNFWLLGLIIEKASGMTYADYVEKKIFEPLGMTRSMYCTNAEKVARRASGYGMRSGRPILVPPIVYTGAQGSGAICSTAEDVITWLKALHGGKLLTPKSYAEMIKPAMLNDGTRLRYSMGLIIGEDANGSVHRTWWRRLRLLIGDEVVSRGEAGRCCLDEQRTRRNDGGDRASGGRGAAGAAPAAFVHG
jgi:CubicO group peptidase (beta-lactamase class C family)